MKHFTHELARRIGPYMKSRGFKRKGGRFYYVQNDIAFCIHLEMPTDLVYVPAYILPLYMPCDYIRLSYGDRIGDLPVVSLPLLKKTDPVDQIEAWCDQLCSSIENTILPIYRSIEKPEQLVQFVKAEMNAERREFLYCPRLHLVELLIYTDLYLRDWAGLDDAINRYEEELPIFPFTPAGQQAKERWLRQMRTLSKSGEEAICEYLAEAKEKTRRFFP